MTTNNKQAGLAKFDPTTGAYGGSSTQIYYLFAEHDEKAIVERWIDANANQLDEKRDRDIVKITRDAGSQFADAAHEVLGTKRTD